MKKILTIAVIALFCIISLSSCSSKKDDSKSSRKTLINTMWHVSTPEAFTTISFRESTFVMSVSGDSESYTLNGNYVYVNPEVTTSNLDIVGLTLKGVLSSDGDTLYLTLNGNTAALTIVN